jgi:hypothetical protein
LPISLEGRPRCQEVRALAVDAEVGRLILTALTPDRLALAVAAASEIEEEARAMERQWSLKRERARYDAERARRQVDAVEPENRQVARSLERVWEERLRRMDQIEHEYNVVASRAGGPGAFAEAWSPAREAARTAVARQSRLHLIYINALT